MKRLWDLIAFVVRRIARALRLLTRAETTLSEFTSSLLLIWMGGMLIHPSHVLTDRVPFQAAMLRIMSESEWGLLFLLLGVGHGVASIFNQHLARAVLCFILSIAYGFLSILGTVVEPTSPFFAVFGTMSASMGLSYLCLSLEASGEKKRRGK